MFMSAEVVADGNAEIFPTVEHFQCLTVEAVCSLYLVALVGNDADDLAFLRVELHLPRLFPFLQGLKISLDWLSISIAFDEFVEQAVVSEEARIRCLDKFR